MNTRRMAIYFNDHLSLMVGEIELANRCQSSNKDTDLALFLSRLKSDVIEQKSAVRRLLSRIGAAEAALKKGAAWLAEKLGRLKLNDSILEYSNLSRLVELEGLCALAQQRVLFWETLESLGAHDARLIDIDARSLAARSRAHLDALASHRRQAAIDAFR